MRAAATVKLLAKWRAVHLIVIPVFPAGAGNEPDHDIKPMLSLWQSIMPAASTNENNPWNAPLRGCVPRTVKPCTESIRAQVDKAIDEIDPDLIFAFRLYIGAYFSFERAKQVPFWLDLDELESRVQERRIPFLIESQPAHVAQARTELAGYRLLEEQLLPRFGRIFVASNLEAENIRIKFPSADIRVMPNSYPWSRPLPASEPASSANLLFVGNFGYYPNGDAMINFSKNILPELTKLCSKPIETVAVGAGVSHTGTHAGLPGISFRGYVEDLSESYQKSTIIIVPLRTGGGTRIKILEAFSFARAVVSTSFGAEGLAVRHGEHLKIADDPKDFAAHCAQLIEDESERLKIARAGHEFFVRNHLLSSLEASSDKLFEE